MCRSSLHKRNLYLVATGKYSGHRDPLRVVEEAAKAGADIVQFREKDLDDKEARIICGKYKDICDRAGSLFVVNDDPLLAADTGAGGVHLGQTDLLKYPIDKARKILGGDAVIGVSTHSLKELKIADDSDCDYIAFGPVFPTLTKSYHIGIDDIEKAVQEASKPVFFIGGINLDNIKAVIDRGAQRVAVIRAIMEAEDVYQTVKSFKRILSAKREL